MCMCVNYSTKYGIDKQVGLVNDSLSVCVSVF